MSFKAFQFGASPPPPDHLGCFEDDHCGRIFSKPAIEMNRKNTAEVRDDRIPKDEGRFHVQLLLLTALSNSCFFLAIHSVNKHLR